MHDALKGMGSTKAPREDGFPALVFQNYWHIIGNKVIKFCLQVLNEDLNIKAVNITNTVLLLKIPHPTNLVNFKPISLSNVVYKIISKMLVNRMKGLMDACIDISESAFVPSKLISNNILIAYEVMHTL